ncbi:MAG: UDP-glucose 4-epimerase GalE [Alphaproteobacteria bacterium]|nr:MAG: UDP-glucose 4-epimerase GalE [Alphaproteobacteria bacterium]
MSVLVTGGAGYIGSHMVWELLDHGEEVVVLDDLSTGFKWAVPDRARLVVGDAGDINLVGELIEVAGIDAVIHFAGSVVVPESIRDPLKYYENNTAKTRNLLQAVVAAGIDKFIFSSTAAVYGAPPTMGAIREDAILNPMSPYGSSKLMSEIMVRDTADAHGLRYVMLRYFNVAGSDPRKRAGQSTLAATHLIKVACETALGKRSHMSIFGTDYDTPDGTCVRDFIHVGDLVNAHYAALNFLRQGGLKFTANCGYSRGYSVREVVETVQRISGSRFRVVEEKRRPGDIPSLVANSHRLESRLGWKPRFGSLEAIVESALAWERELDQRRKSA